MSLQIFRYSKLLLKRNSAPVYCQNLSTLHIAEIVSHVIPARLVYQSGSSIIVMMEIAVCFDKFLSFVRAQAIALLGPHMSKCEDAFLQICNDY